MRKRAYTAACLTFVLLSGISDPGRSEELHGFILPDDGPRYGNIPDGPDKTLFLQGVAANKEEDFLEAQQVFTAFLKAYPASPFAMAARAFLADLIAKKGTDQDRRIAIEAYRVLLHDDPSSNNAARTRWRIGDLYALGHMLVEARATYEQVLVHAPKESGRALLGLGLLLLDSAEWKEAEHTFDQVRARTEDPRLLLPATFGLAEALYRQELWERAQSIYEAGMRQWPAGIDLQPQMLIFLADVKTHLKKEPEARGLLEKFYNLYPSRSEAPSVLIHIGDSWRQVSRADRAKTLYAAVLGQYAGTPQAALARMRLAELDKDARMHAEMTGPQLGIDALFEGRRSTESDSHEQEAMFEEIAQTYTGTELGSEALFHLGEHLESVGRRLDAVQVYRRVSDRKGQVEGDPWPTRGGLRLVQLLGPWMESALDLHDDWTAMNLFYRHGTYGADLYAGQEVMLHIADIHYRMGFFPQAIKLYHAMVKPSMSTSIRERAMYGLGRTYYDQRDFKAAKRVFERLLLQFPAAQTKPAILQYLAETLRAQTDWSGVIRVCKLWLRHETTHPLQERQRMRLLMARAQVESGQSFQALETLSRLVSVKGHKREGWLHYADQLFLAQQYDRAAEQYSQVIQDSPSATDGEWARLQLAKVRRVQKRYPEARTLLKDVQSTTTDDLVSRISAAMLTDIPEEKKKAG